MDGTELDAGYWYANLRRTVRLKDAIEALAADGYGAYIEMSPHPMLEVAVADTIEATRSDTRPVISGTIHRDSSGADHALSAMARVFARGVTVDWAAVLGDGRRVDLPTYAFRHQRFWPQAQSLPVPAVAGGDGAYLAATEADALFWAAVEHGDLQALAVDGRRPFGEVLPELVAWRRRERDRSVTEAWRYRITWVPVADPDRVALAGTWLIVMPAGDCARELAAGCRRALESRGTHVVVAEVATDICAERTVLSTLVTGLVDPGAEVSGVLSLLALNEAPPAGYPVVPGGLAGTLALVQALGDAGMNAPLWVATRGAVSTGADDVLLSPVQVMTWGLGRAAALEYPDRWGGLIDLPPVLDERAAGRLSAVLAGCGEDQVAIRSAGILARRLARAPLAASSSGPWTPNGSVLVTGGNGALAGHVARWLAGRAAPRVVLASRSGPAASGAAARAADLAADGAAAEVIACDVAEREQVAGLLTRIAAGGPRLCAVVHTAGTLDDGVLDGLDAGRLASVLAARAAGAAHLDELTRDAGLDQFVLFSSAAATFGGAGQGNYAAANAFLDGLAQHRAGLGLAGLSLAWGPWAGGGVAEANEAVRHRLQRGPLALMDPDLAVKALDQALEGADSLLGIMDVDWAQHASSPSPFVQDLPDVARLAQAPDADAGEPTAKGGLARRLAGMPKARQIQELADLIRAGAAAVLGHDSDEAVAPDRAFTDLGFDSLTSLEMRQHLNTVTGLRLPATLLFDYPTPAVLAGYLHAELVGDQAPITDAVPAVPGASADGEPVAIVAMSCRYPGGARTPDDLWQLVISGTDAVSGFPVDRGWQLARPRAPADVRAGGFVREVAGFDAGVLRISPREALAMDPQQRLLLEVSWEALERAGIDPAVAARLDRPACSSGGYGPDTALTWPRRSEASRATW